MRELTNNEKKLRKLRHLNLSYYNYLNKWHVKHAPVKRTIKKFMYLTLKVILPRLL
ncbi:Uncharacterised protein [Mycobacteroides abscessus subsp. abscessus]|nr:Uncharacterised protein [Mycobacteroides abscessus subsp. abscessus]